MKQQLATYAELLVKHGMNVQKGQDVFITSELIHREFVQLLVETSYKAGARYVHIDLLDPEHLKTRVLTSQNDTYLEYVPSFIPFRADHLIEEGAATCRILGSEDPDLYASLPPKKLHAAQIAVKKKLKRFYEVGIGQSKVQWTIAACPTLKWAEKVFPEVGGQKAYDLLWKDILMMTRADQPNCLALWKEHNDALHRRAEKLTKMQFKTLHFKGPGTDLRVGLTPRSLFKGGGDMGPRGVEYEPNIPTEECFTTPDCHATEGVATATRPFLINGTMIRGLKMEFKKGRIVHFSAEEGEETFREYISSDEGANRLGEVALVGIDSPIYQTGRIYEEILFDENAACHIAVGFAYHFCVAGADKMSPEELHANGVNSSSVHTDMMISSEKVDVSGILPNGQEFPIIEGGHWVEEYR